MSKIAIFDSSILIDQLRTGRHAQHLDSLTAPIRSSSVVLAEMWRGARRAPDREFLRKLAKNHPILSPTTNNWLESGQILARIAVDHGFMGDKLRDLHLDVLIALTARSYGGTIITGNRQDFELIRNYKPFQLEIW